MTKTKPLNRDLRAAIVPYTVAEIEEIARAAKDVAIKEGNLPTLMNILRLVERVTANGNDEDAPPDWLMDAIGKMDEEA
jgi:hypothetical protein